jgi:type VI secretion system protein ImpK
VENIIGVLGEDMLLWICMLKQSPTRPPAEHVHRQANFMLDEIKASKVAQELPVVSVDDAMFAIAAVLDETAMSLPDLRPLWSVRPLQSTRWMTNNAGVELFERLNRVRQGPKAVFATYVVVLGIGFMGRFGLPGVDRYLLVQLRRQLSLEMGIDPDRDWTGGVIKQVRADAGPSALLPREPWWRSVWVGRSIALFLLLGALITLTLLLVAQLPS